MNTTSHNAFQYGEEAAKLDPDESERLAQVRRLFGENEDARNQYEAGFIEMQLRIYSEFEEWIPENPAEAIRERMATLLGERKKDFALAIMTGIACGNTQLKAAFPEYAHADPQRPELIPSCPASMASSWLHRPKAVSTESLWDSLSWIVVFSEVLRAYAVELRKSEGTYDG